MGIFDYQTGCKGHVVEADDDRQKEGRAWRE